MGWTRFIPAAIAVLALAGGAVALLLAGGDEGRSLAAIPPPAPCEPDARDRNPGDRAIAPSRDGPLTSRVGRALPYGFNDAAYETGQLELDEALELYRRAGASLWRLPLDWGKVERERGTLDFSHYDEIYCAALAAGVRIDWHITGIPAWSAPLGACGEPCVRPPEDEHLRELRRFAEAAAIRYPRSAAFEAWNEPNLVSFWGGRPSPAAYVKVMEAIYAGVKDGDPEMPVLGGALSNNPTDEADGNVSLRTFLAAILELGAEDHMDGFSLHAYPIAPIGEEGDQFTAALATTRSLLGADVRIWVTETGAPTEEGGFAPAMSEAGQAEAMTAIYDELAVAPDVDAVLFHTLVDPGPDVPGGPGFGFFDEPTGDALPAAKPVACAVFERAHGRRPCPASQGS